MISVLETGERLRTTSNDKCKERKRKLVKLEMFKLPGREPGIGSGVFTVQRRCIKLNMDGNDKNEN